MRPSKLETFSADDVVIVRGVEGAEVTEVRLTIDTGDEKTTTTLTAEQARALAAALIAHAKDPARHSTSCYVEQENNADRGQFWVCGPLCATRSPWPMAPTNEELARRVESLLASKNMLVDVACDPYDIGYWGRVAGLRRPDVYAYRLGMRQGWRQADAELVAP